MTRKFFGAGLTRYRSFLRLFRALQGLLALLLQFPFQCHTSILLRYASHFMTRFLFSEPA